MKAVFFIGLFIGILVQYAEADVRAKGKELIKVQSQINHVDKKLHEIAKDKRSLRSQLKVLEKKYGQNAARLAKIKKNIRGKNKKIKSLRRGIIKQQKKAKKQNKALEGQVKAAYVMGRQQQLKLILNQEDPVLFGRMMAYYDVLNKSRLKKITEINQTLNNLKRLQLAKSTEIALLKDDWEQEEIERQVLAQTQQRRKKVLAQLKKSFSSNKQRLKQLKLSEKKLKSLVLSLQTAMDDFPFNARSKEPFYKLKGKLSWPIKGRLVKRFGSKRSEGRWDGVLIDAKEGTEIHTVSRGRVVYADWLRGYGLLVIIEHGKGYMSLYAFNQSLYREVGDWVEAGDVVATVGKSGGRKQVGLYFSIRRKGKPVNPVKWCRKVRRGRVG